MNEKLCEGGFLARHKILKSHNGSDVVKLLVVITIVAYPLPLYIAPQKPSLTAAGAKGPVGRLP
jgi:hypothetical protein